MSVQNLIQVIEAQTLLMNELAGLEQRMLLAVLKKNAAAAQASADKYGTLAAAVEQAEGVRLALIRKIAARQGIVSHPESSARPVELFARIMDRLEPGERAHLSSVQRVFKISLERLSAVNKSLRTFTHAQLATLDSFMTELFPERSQSVYSAEGRQVSSVRPQLVNRQV